ncbi:hypothetical protein ACHAWF_017120 [Thalassiosira exigua]
MLKRLFSAKAVGSNEEWPEITSAAIGERRRYKLPQQSPEPEEICLKSIASRKDLESLKKRDSFSYYSIPAVHSAALLGKEIDTSDLNWCSLSIRHGVSCPSRIQTQSTRGDLRSQTVTRKKVISFEVHPDLILGDLIDEGCEDFDDDDLVDEDLLDFLNKIDQAASR